MAAAKKSAQVRKPKLVVKFKQTVNVEIIVPTFVPLATVKLLDVQKLSKGSHTIEVGFLEGGCCPKLVRAVIRNGMVARFDVEPCDDTTRLIPREMSPDIAAIVVKAKKMVRKHEWKPVPVGQFVDNITRDGEYPPRIGTGAGCFYICLGHYCLFCCWNVPGFCWIEERV